MMCFLPILLGGLFLFQPLLNGNESFKKIPKAELHLHLGGSFPLDFLQSVASIEDFEILKNGIERISKTIPYNEGFQIFQQIARIVDTEEKLEKGTWALCQELARDGVVYAEIRTSLKNLKNGPEEYLKAVLRGIEKGKTPQFEARVLLSLWRYSSPEQAKKTVDLAIQYRDQGVVGIDVSGDSTLGDISPILPELLRAKREGFFITLHLGESPRETDQIDLLEILQPDRVGHGVFLTDEAQKWILQNQIPVEMCLSSAFLVQMIPFYSSHPGLVYFLRGHPVVLGSDDPLIFDTCLSKEFQLVSEQPGFDLFQATQMAQYAFDSVFLSEVEKKKLKNRFLEPSVLLNEPPANFSLKAEVACVLPFIENNHVLLLQRVPTHPQGNLWTAPGGKIKSGENPCDAAARELEEETGVEVDPKELTSLGKFYVRYPNGDFIFYLFKISLSSPFEVKICKEEHQTYQICPLEKISTLSLTPGLDECFVRAQQHE